MSILHFGHTSFEEDRLISAKVLHRSFVAGYDDHDRPEKGFFKKLLYKPTPILKEADFLVARYRLEPDEYHVRSGVVHSTAYVCLCRDPEAYAAVCDLASRCKKAYGKASNDKRTTLERSEDFHFLMELGLIPSLVEEDDDDAGGLAASWMSSRGASFITYSYLQSDFDEFRENIFQLEENWPELPGL